MNTKAQNARLQGIRDFRAGYNLASKGKTMNISKLLEHIEARDIECTYRAAQDAVKLLNSKSNTLTLVEVLDGLEGNKGDQDND